MTGEMINVVAIDGPAGAGKSTVARSLAEHLDVAYLDTGAMYRAVAFAVLRRGVDPGDRDATAKVAESCEIAIEADAIIPRATD